MITMSSFLRQDSTKLGNKRRISAERAASFCFSSSSKILGIDPYLPLSQCDSGFGSCAELQYIVRLAGRDVLFSEYGFQPTNGIPGHIPIPFIRRYPDQVVVRPLRNAMIGRA